MSLLHTGVNCFSSLFIISGFVAMTSKSIFKMHEVISAVTLLGKILVLKVIATRCHSYEIIGHWSVWNIFISL